MKGKNFRIVSVFLVPVGAFFNFISKLYIVSVSAYKTHRCRKENPGVMCIGYKTFFDKMANVKIGKNTCINGGEFLTRKGGHIYIGANCMISYDVILRTDMHNYDDVKVPMISQGVKTADIHIEDDVWIGQGAIIMPGVTVHRGGGNRCSCGCNEGCP